jgi:hypothetical protein
MPFTACHTHHQPHPHPPHHQPNQPQGSTKPAGRHGRDRRCTPVTATKKPAHPAQSTRHAHTQTRQHPHHPRPHPGTTPRRNSQKKQEPCLRCSRPLSRSQTTTPHHPTTPHQRGGQAGMAGNESPAAPPGRRLAPTPHARLILQNPNSVSANPPPPHTHTHTHTVRGARCAAGRMVRPSTSLRHHRRPDTHGPGQGACSLERR